MAFKKNYETPEELNLLPPCSELRSKAMMISGTREDKGSIRDADNENCWCNKTQDIVGPDAEMVERHSCVEGRTCYKRVL